jgi:hypothetical protein
MKLEIYVKLYFPLTSKKRPVKVDSCNFSTTGFPGWEAPRECGGNLLTACKTRLKNAAGTSQSTSTPPAGAASYRRIISLEEEGWKEKFVGLTE